MSQRVVFLGSKPIGYQCLQYLIAQQQALDIEVVAVRTRMRKEFGAEGNDLAALATQAGIPLLASLDDIPECDLIYSVQHHELLQARHISRAGTIAVNLHLAPLPEYRGCNQFSFAIMDEVREFGVTLHEIDTRIDHGAILFESRFSVPESCWVNELYELTFVAATELFKSSLPDLMAGRYQKVPQAALLEQRGTSLHFRDEIGDLKAISLDDPEALIDKKIRATYMPGFEPPYIMVNGQKMLLVKP
ncbi:formyltransferase family protein [Taibaiella chishuiensis]|uniref:Methionyl-tRNA formyltransferase n=1 Tax=Taibaiella chishuiensis TaxID=1434707 RepID=A0A2P8D9I7_9BACT|nr:formyltransferase family protein [Taibaiella chishuiensis]PSK93884.1 methionyl-tRNA formyltransferase [Taibaiella chishuiensis]